MCVCVMMDRLDQTVRHVHTHLDTISSLLYVYNLVLHIYVYKGNVKGTTGKQE